MTIQVEQSYADLMKEIGFKSVDEFSMELLLIYCDIGVIADQLHQDYAKTDQRHWLLDVAYRSLGQTQELVSYALGGITYQGVIDQVVAWHLIPLLSLIHDDVNHAIKCIEHKKRRKALKKLARRIDDLLKQVGQGAVKEAFSQSFWIVTELTRNVCVDCDCVGDVA